jgi:hypothetical protein
MSFEHTGVAVPNGSKFLGKLLHYETKAMSLSWARNNEVIKKTDRCSLGNVIKKVGFV